MFIRLRAALSQETQHTLLQDGLPLSWQVDVRPLINSAYLAELPAASELRRLGLRKRIKAIFSRIAKLAGHPRNGRKRSPEPLKVDTILIRHEAKDWSMSPSSTWSSCGSCHWADHKDTPCISELSPDSVMGELYSPPANSPSDHRGGFDYFGFHQSPCHAAYTVSRYNAPGTPVAELPSNWDGSLRSNVATPVVTKHHVHGIPAAELSSDDCAQLHTPTLAFFASTVPHPTWPQHNAMSQHEIDDDSRCTLDVAQLTTLAIPDRSQAAPDLSPQASSSKSSPITLDTPVTAGDDISTLSRDTYTALLHAVSPSENFTPSKYHTGAGEPYIQMSPDHYVPLEFAETHLAGSEFVDVPIPTANLPTDEHVTVNTQAIWPQMHGMAFQPNLLQGETRFEVPIATWNGTPFSHSGFDPELNSSFFAPSPSLRRSRTSPSVMVGLQQQQQPSLSNFCGRNGSWPKRVNQAYKSLHAEAPTRAHNRVDHVSLDQITGSSNAGANERSSSAAHLDTPSTLGRMFPPAKCEYCRQVFTGQYARGNRRRHVVHLHGHVVIDCKRCDKSFNRRDALRNHERSAHPEMDHAPRKKRKSPLKRHATC